jgi:hypothetical protein
MALTGRAARADHYVDRCAVDAYADAYTDADAYAYADTDASGSYAHPYGYTHSDPACTTH